ncbi:MAG: hypothetical protein BroJett018_47410 [Chloroflexota bacterium]|nr:MAG: hypothetical protein BroJett018_47410 [Chloroflexota bacterium]
MTFKRIALLTFIVVLMAALIAVHNATRSKASDDAVIIHVVEHADTDVVTDTGAEGDSVGDILTFANEVYDENDAELVGSDNGYCVRTVVGAAWECFWTLTLADGQITVEGPFSDTGDTVLAITGGTGAYAHASGQMELKWHNAEGTAFDFIYEVHGLE